MGFIVGKLIWAIVAPGNLLLLVLAYGTGKLVISRRRRGLPFIVLAVLALLVIAVLPLGPWLVMPLEARFPPPVLPPRIDGIIVLGGAVEEGITRDHGQVALTDAAERLVEALRLARRYPDAKLLLSGGEGRLLPQGESEAQVMREFFVEQGIDPARLLLEDRSRDTFENAVYSRDLAMPQHGQVWLLVTSAAHMPRAVGCFRRLDWPVVPYPVDYRAEAHPLPGFALAEHLGFLDIVAKEWLGLLVYRILGHTARLFPAP
jgi:uncharacterized SAM-binding protein YcdF (DUF218 family)